MLEIFSGIISGIVSGMGMGGGTILITILVCFMSVDQKVAQASNLIFFIPTSIVATIVNIKNKEILELRSYFSARVWLPWASLPELSPRQSRAGHITGHSRGVVGV